LPVSPIGGNRDQYGAFMPEFAAAACSAPDYV